MYWFDRPDMDQLVDQPRGPKQSRSPAIMALGPKFQTTHDGMTDRPCSAVGVLIFLKLSRIEGLWAIARFELVVTLESL